MEVFWQNQALCDLDDTLAFICEDNPHAALTLVEEIFDSVERHLSDNPFIGRPGRVDNTREFIVQKNYIVVYRLTDVRIDILSVRHTARLWPSEF